jgi:endonuclease YncB( thermonuclease family)
MIDSTIKVYATRAAASLALALGVVVALLAVGPTEARQSTSSPALARGHATLTGRAEAVDGDTLMVGGIRVRLEGIDAPEAEQTCTSAFGAHWPCGLEARRALARLVEGVLVECEERGQDKYKRLLGVCRAGSVELNAELVRRGLAWAFVRYSQSYVAAEAAARAARVGIWSGKAQPAWEYRTDSWQAAETAAPAGCPIKGNVNNNGRIYHMPWSPWYGRIKMDGAKGKRWFCSEAEALAAGWRPANSVQ